MGRRPSPVQLRASVSKHAYLTPLQADWLTERDLEFSPWVRSVIDAQMNADDGFRSRQLAKEIAALDVEQKERREQFEAIAGHPIETAELEAASSGEGEDPEKANYLNLWQFFMAKRPDFCKTLLGTGYGREILSEKQVLDLIGVHLSDKKIVDPPKIALKKLRQFIQSEGLDAEWLISRHKTDTEVPPGEHDTPPAEQTPSSVSAKLPMAPEIRGPILRLRHSLAVLDPKKAKAFLQEHGFERFTEVDETEALALLEELARIGEGKIQKEE